MECTRLVSKAKAKARAQEKEIVAIVDPPAVSRECPYQPKGKGKGTGGFQGECYRCGEKGHPARKCPKCKEEGKPKGKGDSFKWKGEGSWIGKGIWQVDGEESQ